MMAKTKILIVEDTPDVANLIVRIIQRDWASNVDIRLAQDGEEGLCKALEYHPDLIITDLDMPKMRGTDMVRLLRQEQVGNNVPIIGMSGTDLGDSNIIDNLGLFNAFMIKPFTRTELQEKLLILCPELQPIQTDQPI
jgi:DNA-binding response OmpR family regulator